MRKLSGLRWSDKPSQQTMPRSLTCAIKSRHHQIRVSCSHEGLICECPMNLFGYPPEIGQELIGCLFRLVIALVDWKIRCAYNRESPDVHLSDMDTMPI